MQEYCEEQSNCRRKFFSVKFGEVLSNGDTLSTARSFKSCGSMCDNCQAKRGIQRAFTSNRSEDIVKKRKGQEGGGGFRSAKTLILEVKENEANAVAGIPLSGVICIDHEEQPWISNDRRKR